MYSSCHFVEIYILQTEFFLLFFFVFATIGIIIFVHSGVNNFREGEGNFKIWGESFEILKPKLRTT